MRTDFNQYEELILQSFKDGSFIKEKDPSCCALCDWQGFIINSEGKATTCECVINKKLHSLFKEAQIPMKYWDKTISDDWSVHQDGKGRDLGPKAKKSKFIKTFFTNYEQFLVPLSRGFSLKLKHNKNQISEVQSLVVKGGSYSGKTFLASVIAQSCIKKGIAVKFYSWSDISNYLQSYDFREKQELIFSDFEKCEFIFIDGIYDYGLNNKSFIFQLDRLFNQRMQANLPIIITTEMDLENLSYGPAFMTFIHSTFVVNLPE